MWKRAIAAAFLSAICLAQQPPASPSPYPGPPGTHLQVYVTVTDPMNLVVTGLKKENFQLFEDKNPQEITQFTSEDTPVSVGIIFDTSGSMKDKIEASRKGLAEFLRLANPQDEFLLITAANPPQLVSDLTHSTGEIQSRLSSVQPKGRRNLLDAIHLGLDSMKQAHNARKVLLIILGGGETQGRYTQSATREDLKAADIQLYCVGMFEQFARTEEEVYGPSLVSDMAEVTGGRLFLVASGGELTEVATKLANELKTQYQLSYRPSNPTGERKWRKIKVKVLPPKGLPPLHVYAKAGYFTGR